VYIFICCILAHAEWFSRVFALQVVGLREAAGHLKQLRLHETSHHTIEMSLIRDFRFKWYIVYLPWLCFYPER